MVRLQAEQEAQAEVMSQSTATASAVALEVLGVGFVSYSNCKGLNIMILGI